MEHTYVGNAEWDAMRDGADHRVRVGFRPTDELINELAVRSGSITRAQVARRDLERYYAALRASLPRFGEHEALLLCHALRGNHNAHLGSRLFSVVGYQIHLEDLEGVFAVDGKALVARLKRLTSFEQLAVVDAVERYWTSLGPDDVAADIAREVGLIREDEHYWGQRARRIS